MRFQVAHLGAPFLEALVLQAALLSRHLLLTATQLLALPRNRVQLAVELVQEVGNILRLGVLLRASLFDNGRVETEALGDVDPGRSARHA